MVASTDESIDPVGVFVGHKGDRINTVLSLLDGENIDDPKELITRLLKPAQVESLEFKDNGKVTARVEESQKSLAIGRGACNIKLASQLSGYQIEVI